MPNDYATVAELKEALKDSGLSDTSTYDGVLRATISRASRLIDAECKREAGAFYNATETTRYYTGSGSAQQRIDEITAAPSYVGLSETGGVATTDYTSISSSDYFLWPDNSAPYRRIDFDVINGAYSTWYPYRRGVKVTAPFGYSATVPDLIKQAAIIQAGRWFKRGQQGFQDTGAIAELGQLRYTKLDPDVMEIIAHFRKVTV
jgi:hypothetical protein